MPADIPGHHRRSGSPFTLPQLIALVCGVAISLAMVLLAYQARPGYTITFGSSTDNILLDGFHKPEVMDADTNVTFRWTTADASVTLQDIGDQDFDATIRVNGSRPQGQPPPTLSLNANHQQLLQTTVPPDIKDYTFHVPRAALTDGTLVLHIAPSPPFSPPGDVRELGIVALSLQVYPTATSAGFIQPPTQLVASIAATAALLGLVLLFLGWGPGAIFTGSTLVGLLAGWLLATHRLWLTGKQWYLLWPQALVAGALFTLLVWWLGGLALRKLGVTWPTLQRRILLTLMLAAFVVRFGGQVHPQINVVDLNFHVHRLQLVESGQLLFKEFALQAGNRENFYLPGAYLFMVPVNWLLRDERLTVLLITISLSTLGAFLVYYIARRGLQDGRAGVLAAASYLILPVSIIPFSWGITANLFGEFFALLVLSIMATAGEALSPKRPAFWLLPRRKRKAARRKEPIAWAFSALLVAVLVAYALYYVNWTGDILNTLADISRGSSGQAEGGLHVRTSGAVEDPSIGLVTTFAESRSQWVLGGLRGFWQEAQAYFRVWPILGALIGFLLLRRVPSGGDKEDSTSIDAPKDRLHLVLLGWTLSTVLFALVGLVLNLYVRYMLFALPVVALGGGILLSALWQRGRQSPALNLLLLAFFAVELLALWQYRITYLYK
ncbi:MAG TPA: hypothetical protein VM409_08525 [Chloroflexia bacterium]|nr:hypothetical protein [Chloroflexia bacterium]